MTKQVNTLRLSERLQALADMVPSGRRVADVGCDHGFLDIYLVQTGRAPGALAMDVRKGPLSAAREHVLEWKLEDFIETRLSDGLETYQVGEADTLVCAGMGGPLMQEILTRYPEKTASFSELILQPQSEIREFRIFLRENGYGIIEEGILVEEGKYYFPMKVTPPGNKAVREDGTLSAVMGNIAGMMEDDAEKAEETEFDQNGQGKNPQDNPLLEGIYDRFGKKLFEVKHPLLRQYLLEQERIFQKISEELHSRLETLDGGQEEARQRVWKRLKEVEEELEAIHGGLALLE